VTRIGGIVGTHNASTIDDCSNSGDITLAYTATANNWEAAGGIVGFYDGTDGTAVTNGCTNSGKVWATVNSSNANIGAGGIGGHHQVGQCDQQHQRRCGLDAQCPGGQELLCGRHRRLRLQYQGQVGRHGQCTTTVRYRPPSRARSALAGRPGAIQSGATTVGAVVECSKFGRGGDWCRSQ